MIYYKTEKGYYYKKLKNGDCKRVSKACYIKNNKKNDKKGGAKVGNDISNISTGTSWGTITANMGDRYQLSTGRTARKNTEGTKWQVTLPPSNAVEIGETIYGITDGKSWGTIVADLGNSYKLSTGRIARKDTEGTKWQVSMAGSASNPIYPPQRTITFNTIWGQNSWLVDYNGPYDNKRPPHVAVGVVNINSHVPGEVYTLSNLRRQGNAIMWTVDGLYHTGANGTTTSAHFTVYYGRDAHLKDLNSFL